MKKKFRFVMMFGLIFILIGGVITAAAYRYGVEHYSELTEYTDFAQNFDVESVNYLKIVNVAASVFIEEGERFSVVGENIPEDVLRCEIENNILTISMDNDWGINIGFLRLPNFPSMKNFIFTGLDSAVWTDSAKIYIYIPKGKSFNEIWFDDNVGNIEADYLESDKLKIYSNVGNINIGSFKTDDLVLGGGVGNTTLSGIIGNDGNINIQGRVGNTNLTLKEPTSNTAMINGSVGNIHITGDINSNVRIDGGVGNITWDGAIKGDMTVNGGVGNITLNLNGDIDDYNIRASGGLGNTRINGEKYDVGENYNKNTNGASYNIAIDGGVGNIKLTIE